MTHTVRPGFVLVLAAAAALSLTVRGEAAQRNTSPPSGQVPAAGTAQPRSASLEDPDVEQTREKFYELLEKHPPALGRVLKLDPTLMENEAYLAPYPAVSAFLAQHPEVTRNPAYFLERINASGGGYPDQRTEQRRDFYGALGVTAALLMALVVLGLLAWFVRLIVDHRRWNRLSKTQFEVHSKLLDRFSSNEELLAYIQTPAGRKFLESAPIPLYEGSAPMGAPFSRILWSVQAGVVLAIAGLGLLFLSTRLIEEPAQFCFVIGTVTLALGGGFIVSGATAYLLSRRLGLLDRPASDHE
jgi:hypothetical protein